MPGRCSIPAPTRAPGGSPTSAGASCASPSSTGGRGRWPATPDDADVSWGSAEFIAAEEIGRSRGYWWSPDGDRLAVARVDTSPIGRWWIGDPAQPATAPTEIAYPAAGTDNAIVTLHLLGLDGSQVDVDVGPAGVPLPGRRALGRAGRPATSPCSRATSGGVEVLAADPVERHDRRRVPRRRRGVGGAGAGHARPAGRRPPGRWPPTGTAPAACWSTGGRSPSPSCRCAAWSTPPASRSCSLANELDEPTEVARVAVAVRRRARTADDGARRAQRRGRRATPSCCARPGSTATASRTVVLGDDGAARLEIESFAEAPLVRPNVTLLPGGEHGRWPPPSCSPTTWPTTPGSPCCSTPTAGRTRSGCRPPGGSS